MRQIGIAAFGILALTLAGVAAAPQTRTPARDATQQPAGRQIPVGTGVVNGTVLSADTGRPVRNARVMLSGTAGTVPARRGIAAPSPESPGPPTLSLNRTTFTDAQGQFTFERVAAGRYALTATRDGYLNASFGQRRPNTGAYPAIELGDGERRIVALALTRGGVVAGHIYDDSGEPMRNVSVGVYRIDRSAGVKRLQQQGSAISNDRGAYRLFGLQPGSYIVGAVPRVTDFVNDQLASEILTVEQALATGTVRSSPNGGPPFVLAPPTSAGSAGGVVAASSFLPVYFPGTLTPSSARIIQVAGGDEHEGLDITVQFVRATVITGRVLPPPPEGVPVQVLLAATDPMVGTTTMNTSVNPTTGVFTFNNVAPGRYTLIGQATGLGARVIDSSRITVDGKPVTAEMRVQLLAQAGPNGAGPRLWTQAEIVVSGEPSLDVTVALHPPRSLSGRVVYDMARPPSTGQVTLQVVPGPVSLQIGPIPQAQVAPDGSFTLQDVVPGSYYIRTGGTLRSVMVGGDDLLDLPLVVRGDRNIGDVVITVTDRTTQVTGTLTDTRGEPVGNHTVVVASLDQRYWNQGSRRLLSVTTGPYGRYTFTLPPGDYAVLPVTDLEPGLLYDPEFLATVVATGTRVALTEGASVKQDFQIR